MKSPQRVFYFAVIIALFAFLLGCSASDQEPESTAASTITMHSPVPSKMVLPTTTRTITPSPTSTRSPATPTLTSAPTMTFTSRPTLTEEERLAFTQELLRTNAGCKLPCWWGFTPGVTTWSEVETFLRFIGEETIPYPTDDSGVYHGGGSFDFVSSETIIVNRSGYLEREGIIELIYVQSEGYSNPVLFQEQWALFSPQQIIREYGIPSRVLLRSFSGGPVTEARRAGYTLWFFYDQLGFLILYNGSGEFGPTFHFCPRFENGEEIRSFEMYLQSPDNPNPIEKTAEIEIAPYPYVQTIEQAAGLSINEFYTLFVQEGVQACFDTPKDIWPSK